MQNIFWCHNKIYGTDFCCNLFFLRFISHLVNSDAKIDIYFFHYAKVFYEIDLFFLSLQCSLYILSKKYYHNISIIRFNLLLFKIWSKQQTFCLLQTYCINIIDIRPYAEVLLFSCKRISILGYSYFFYKFAYLSL